MFKGTDETTGEALTGMSISIAILIAILVGTLVLGIPIMIFCKYFGL